MVKIDWCRFVATQKDLTRYTDDNRIWWSRFHDHRICANAASFTDRDCTQYLCSCTDHYVIFHGWMSLNFLGAGAAQRHAVIECYVVPNFRSLANHNAHAVVNEEFMPNGCTGMDL